MAANKFQSALLELEATDYQVVRYQQQDQNHNMPQVPVDNDLLIGFLALLPVATDGCCSSTGVGADQISRPYGSSEVGALGQVLSLVTRGEDADMSAWGSSRPTGDLLSVLQIEGQCPAGVDSGDLSHGDRKASENISDYHLGFAHLNPGKPKEQKAHIDNKANQRSACQNAINAIGGKNAGQSQRHGYGNNDGERSSGFSNKDLHPTSVAVNGKVFA